MTTLDEHLKAYTNTLACGTRHIDFDLLKLLDKKFGADEVEKKIRSIAVRPIESTDKGVLY